MTSLTAKDCFVHSDIAKAESLPAASYTEPAFLERELSTIFTRNWQMAPARPAIELRNDPRTLSELVSRRGARAPFALNDRPLFLQRDWKGKLRCFPNVCTHAWHTLVEGPGRERAITCPQHGRTFSCDGKFTAQAGFKGMDDFPRECDHLDSLPVETRDPFIFVSPGKPELALGKLLAPLEKSLGRLKSAHWRRMSHGIEAREVAGNWKLHAGNFMDKFHIGYIHKAPGGLADAVDLASYATELHSRAALQWAYAKDPASGFDPALLPARFGKARRVFALWWFIFPNLALSYYPWGLSVNIYQPVPGRPERTLFHWYHYVADELKYRQRDETWLSEPTDAEDIDALGQVQRGTRSGFAPRGRFAPLEETGPHWFHRLVSTGVFPQPK